MNTPKSQRLTLALAGKTNAGKSTLLNFIAGQDVAITSPIAGTTTDVVEKAMELLPFGPVLWLDTGGWDDVTELGEARKKRTQNAIERADVVLAVISAETSELDNFVKNLAMKKPLIIIITKCDTFTPSDEFIAEAKSIAPVICVNATEKTEKSRDVFLADFKREISAALPQDFIKPQNLLDGIVPKNGTVLQIIPIDSQAPKGRIILPQMNVLRNALDEDYISVVVTENRIKEAVERYRPDLAICDSQVVHKMIADLPSELPCTTYSILMAKIKGDLNAFLQGENVIENLKDGDKILIAEACTHHAADEDIGRVKIPNWLRKFTGKNLEINVFSGRDFPDDLSDYALIIHCGGCMINRALMLHRIEQANAANVPITNYGICISIMQGVVKRVMMPFQK